MKKVKSIPLGKSKRTPRGFESIEFRDRYNVACSLQASSLAEYKEPGTSAVWLGVDNADPQVLWSDARSLGIKTEKTCGWVPFPIPESVLLKTRMHLDRQQVAALIKHLQHWLKTGSFNPQSAIRNPK